MTPLLPHVREPAGEPDVCAYCCEEWMDVDPCIEWTYDRADALDRILAVERRRAAAGYRGNA